MKKNIINIYMIAAMTAALSMTSIAAETEAVTETFTGGCPVYNFADDYVEKVAMDGNPVMNVVGPWQDQTSQRAVMSIACEGENGAVAVIDWADDAFTLTRWVLHGTMDDKGVITYTNGDKMKIVSKTDEMEEATEEGIEVEGTTLEYSDGEGTIVQNEDGTLTWNDKKENAGEGCVFTFNMGSTIGNSVEIEYGKSELYSEEDMNQAINQIEKEFSGWDGCELHSISYSSDDENNTSNLKWMNELESANDGKETFTQVIMFTSNFHSPKDKSGAWNPDEEYTDWQWWLARSDGGEWKLMTWGY